MQPNPRAWRPPSRICRPFPNYLVLASTRSTRCRHLYTYIRRILASIRREGDESRSSLAVLIPLALAKKDLAGCHASADICLCSVQQSCARARYVKKQSSFINTALLYLRFYARVPCPSPFFIKKADLGFSGYIPHWKHIFHIRPQTVENSASRPLSQR